MKNILIKVLSSWIFTSLVVAMIFTDTFFYILFGLGLAILILIGCGLCGLLQYLFIRFKIRNSLLELITYIVMGLGYMVILAGIEWKGLVIGMLIGISYHASVLVVRSTSE